MDFRFVPHTGLIYVLYNLKKSGSISSTIIFQLPIIPEKIYCIFFPVENRVVIFFLLQLINITQQWRLLTAY